MIEQLLSPPGIEHLHLMSYLVFFMMLFHLPYLGMVFGSSALSVVYRKWKPDLSDLFLQTALGKPWVWVAFGLLPALSLAFLFKMLLFNTPVAIHLYLLRIIALMAGGFVLLEIYRRTRNILFGAGGVLLVAGYCFHFVNLMSLLLYPEKWPFLKYPVPYPLFSVTPLIQFGAFLFLALIVTGAAILFFFFKWSERKLPPDHPHYDIIRYHGYGLLLAGGLLLPVIIFLDLFTLPQYSLSKGVYVLSGLIVVVVSLIVGAAASMIKKYDTPTPKHGVTAFLMALLLFGLVIAKDRTLQANASRETIAVLEMDAAKAHAQVVNKREEIYAKAMVIDPAMGEQIYNERCTACHSFDRKILGPSFNESLPKYFGKLPDLEKFILNPVKIDPAYPAMPSQGLSTIQVKAVVKFLMQKMGQDKMEQDTGDEEKSTEGEKGE